MQRSDLGADAGTVTRRVALISSSYFPHPGGVEEHVRNVARELAARGHAVEVWTVDRGEHLGVRQDDGFVVRYLPTPLPAMNPRSLASFLLAFPGAWRQWTRAVKAFRPDVLNIQCFGPNGVYAAALQRWTRTPLVLSAHGETFMDEDDVFAQSRLLSTALRRALKDAAAVTGCSQHVLDDLRKRFGLVGGSVVPNGVELDEPVDDTEPPPDYGGSAAPTVFAVGRMVRVKGFDLLVRAFAAANLPDTTRLVIGGDGPERDAVAALGAALGLGDRLVLPGRMSRTAVIKGMASADLVVVPSRIEAFGIVVLEAWRSGTALLATSRGGPADLVVDGEDGLLVDPKDTRAFAAALASLMADPALRERMGVQGSRRVSGFSWGRTVDHYLAIYEALPRGARRAQAVRNGTPADPDAPLRVLLISPLRGIDPNSGDVTYTEQLLAAPPPGVTYTTYADAISDGSLIERGTRQAIRSSRAWQRPGHVALAAWRKAERAYRGSGRAYNEALRHFSVTPGAYDLIHVHCFHNRFLGSHPPVVVSAAGPLRWLYSDAWGWAPSRVASAERFDQLVGRVWDATMFGSRPGRADRFVAFTTKFKDFLVSTGWDEESIDVIPNYSTLAAPTPKMTTTPHTIGFIAKDFDAKGGQVALDAFRRLRLGHPELAMTVVGSPSRMSDGECRELGVTWFPFVERSRLLQDVLPTIDILLYPSFVDAGIPYGPQEALAAGIPLVVSDYGSLAELVGDSAGRVARPTTAQAVADATETLLEPSAWQAASNAASRRYLDRFSAATQSALLGETYRRLLQERATSARKAKAQD